MQAKLKRCEKVMEVWPSLFDTRFSLAKTIVKEIEEIQLEHAVLDSKLLVGALDPENVNLAELISGFHEWAERFLDMKIRMEGILEGQQKRELKRKSSDTLFDPASP